MTTHKEALMLALGALEYVCRHYCSNIPEPVNSAITAIKEALAQPEQEPVACDSEMKAQAKRAYPHDEKRELAFIDGWLSRDATQQQNFVAIDWGAVHNKLMDVWHRELSADEGLDEIQGLINTTPPQSKEPEQEPDYAWPTIEDYENDVGFTVGDAFKIGWSMARTTNDLFTQMAKQS